MIQGYQGSIYPLSKHAAEQPSEHAAADSHRNQTIVSHVHWTSLVFLEPPVSQREALPWDWQLSRPCFSTDKCGSLQKTKSHVFSTQPIQTFRLAYIEKTARTDCCVCEVTCITFMKHSNKSSNLFQKDKKLHNRYYTEVRNMSGTSYHIFLIQHLVKNFDHSAAYDSRIAVAVRGWCFILAPSSAEK